MRKKSRKAAGTYCVFLSHSHKDGWISGVMREKMTQRGVNVWLDIYDLPGGGDVRDHVKEGMLKCDECLLLLSPASRHSAWVIHEGGMAHALGKWIAPLLMHVERSELPPTVRDLSPLDINDFDAYLDQLLTRSRAKTGLPK